MVGIEEEVCRFVTILGTRSEMHSPTLAITTARSRWATKMLTSFLPFETHSTHKVVALASRCLVLMHKVAICNPST
jgi:hypothetical protein